jgi:phage shock protein C
MAGPKTRFYVDKRHKKVAGVCAGLSEYFGWDVTLVRIGAVGSIFVAGPFVPVAYLLASFMAPARPDEVEREMKLQDREEKEFWRKVRNNPRATARSVKLRFRDIERRLAHTEAYLTSPDKRLAREIEQLR